MFCVYRDILKAKVNKLISCLFFIMSSLYSLSALFHIHNSKGKLGIDNPLHMTDNVYPETMHSEIIV